MVRQNRVNQLRRQLIQSACVGVGILLVARNAALGQGTIPAIEAEARIVNDSGGHLLEFIKLSGDLDGKSRIEAVEVSRLEQGATRAKEAIPALKKSLQAIVEKAGNELNEAALIRKAEQAQLPAGEKTKLIDALKKIGDPKSAIQRAIAELDNVPNLINQEVVALRRKHTQLLPFEIVSPAYAKWPVWKCAVASAV